ncbi:MAG TPA: hypothetical protein VGG40_06675 [Solirubrobacterales bacterium]
MSILDDAIREHLELKRAHGADEAELKRLEDEAFGPAERPDQAGDQVDPFAEAPTEFLTAPGETGEAPAEPGGRRINVADLQEPPPPKPIEPEQNAEDADAEGPSEEEHPAMEHETVAQPAPEDKPAEASAALEPDPEAPSEEREAIADQPTELFDVEGQFEDTAEPAVDPLADIDDSGGEVEVTGPAREEEPEDEFDEFFSEQRLSDELNQALEAPLPDEPGAPATDETASPFLDPEAELGPEPGGEEPDREEPETGEGADDAENDEAHGPGHADALEDTPEFLEESPEDDDAWFEQRPPKDFDFGD